MVQVLVCKNDGSFEFEPVELKKLDLWSEVKWDLARTLYTEEELFAIASASEITLYRLPDGDDIEIIAENEPLQQFVINDSKWVLDIFSGPFRRMSDLTIQTEQDIRGMRCSSSSSSMLPNTRRISSRLSLLSNTSNTSPTSSPDKSQILEGSFNSNGSNSTNRMMMMANEYNEPYIHIGTWAPMLVRDKSKLSANFLEVLRPQTSEYEDVLVTTNRAREYINRFRRIGRPVTILSMQTVTLPLAIACPITISQQGSRVLYDGVYKLTDSELQRGFIQAVRLWFSFDCEQTISVTKVNGTLGLKPLRQQDGWIIVQAIPGSPCFEAGMRGEEIFLTHVNGVDVSPHAFPSVTTKFAQKVSWKDSVIPLVEKCETCLFTFF
jgi:hypothetical protein